MNQRRTGETTFDVRVWRVEKEPHRRGQGTSYRVRWSVAGQRKSRSFTTAALADSERSALMTALRRGEAFDVATGLPVSRLVAEEQPVTWWEWALRYVDEKWAFQAPRSRRATAEALITATSALTTGARGPSPRVLRSAMFHWGFNAARRQAGPPDKPHQDAIRWLERNTQPLSALEDAVVVRGVLNAISRKLDGSRAAPTTFARKRAVLYNVLELAVEHHLLQANPLARVKWTPPKVSEAVDPRSMPNPEQATALLAAVAEVPGGAPLVAFFGAMYYSALRPGEAQTLSKANLDVALDAEDWGWLLLSKNDPEVSGSWVDGGRRAARQLKHRAEGEVRRVPCPPPLTCLLKQHIDEYGTAGDGRLFRGQYGGRITTATYTAVWAEAREKALTPAQAASPLAARPYDLRHAAVSTWLAAGVDSAKVAAWAGHSVAVLHRVYAHVLAGRDETARQRIGEILGLVTPRRSEGESTHSTGTPPVDELR